MFFRKYLGEGCQFRVFRCFYNKVLKIPLSEAKIANKLFSQDKRYNSKQESIDAARYYCTTRKIAYRFFLGNFNNEKFANTETLPRGKVIQDRILPLNDFAKVSSEEILANKINEILPEIVKINYFLWTSGVAEITFGMDKYGLNKKDKVILYDPFEMTNRLDDLIFLIKNKWWLQCNSYLPSKVQRLIDYKFSKELSLKTAKFYFNQQTNKKFLNSGLINPIKNFEKNNKC